MVGLQPIASFDDWTKLVRAPLVWLGMPDPASSIFSSMATDPDREILGRLLTGWWETFGDAPTSVSDLAKKCEIAIGYGKETYLVDSVREIAEQRGTLNRKKLGRWISRHQGQIVEGKKLTRGTRQSGSERWVVSSIAISPHLELDAGSSNEFCAAIV